MGRTPRPSTRNHRNLHRRTHHRRQLAVEAVPHPIRIHTRQQNLPRPPRLRLPSPIHHPQPRSLAPPTHIHLSIFNSLRPHSTPGIHRHNYRLRPKAPANLPNQLRPRNRRRVDAHLIRPRRKHRLRILRTPNPAPHRKRHKQLLRRPLHRIQQRPAPFMRRRNIQQHNLIRPSRSMTMRQLRRIPRIHNIHKLHTLHHPPTPHIQARNNSFRQHSPCLLSRNISLSRSIWTSEIARRGMIMTQPFLAAITTTPLFFVMLCVADHCRVRVPIWRISRPNDCWSV